MKSQKLNDAQWRITAPDGAYLDLHYFAGQWHLIMPNGEQKGNAHEKRFNAKVEAEKLLNGEAVRLIF